MANDEKEKVQDFLFIENYIGKKSTKQVNALRYLCALFTSISFKVLLNCHFRILYTRGNNSEK